MAFSTYNQFWTFWFCGMSTNPRATLATQRTHLQHGCKLSTQLSFLGIAMKCDENCLELDISESKQLRMSPTENCHSRQGGPGRCHALEIRRAINASREALQGPVRDVNFLIGTSCRHGSSWFNYSIDISRLCYLCESVIVSFPPWLFTWSNSAPKNYRSASFWIQSFTARQARLWFRARRNAGKPWWVDWGFFCQNMGHDRTHFPR